MPWFVAIGFKAFRGCGSLQSASSENQLFVSWLPTGGGGGDVGLGLTTTSSARAEVLVTARIARPVSSNASQGILFFFIMSGTSLRGFSN